MLSVAQTKANESANTNTYHKWKSCLRVRRSLLVHLLLFFSLFSFYHWLRNKPWADFHFVWNTGPIQGISSTRQKRREHNGILLLLFLLCIYVSIVWLCCHVFLHMQFDAVYSVYLLRDMHSTLKNSQESNSIQSIHSDFCSVRLNVLCSVYNTLNIHCDLSTDFSRGIVDCFFCVLFYFCFIHVQFRFCCCYFFNRFVFG